MQPTKSDSDADKPYKIKLTFTEAVVYALLSALLALGCIGLLSARLHKHSPHGGADWIASVFFLFMLLNLERTVKFAVLAVRTRRLVLQDRQMQERQKRAGWQ